MSKPNDIWFAVKWLIYGAVVTREIWGGTAHIYMHTDGKVMLVRSYSDVDIEWEPSDEDLTAIDWSIFK